MSETTKVKLITWGVMLVMAVVILLVVSASQIQMMGCDLGTSGVTC